MEYYFSTVTFLSTMAFHSQLLATVHLHHQFLALVYHPCQWLICTIGSCDTAGGQGPQNRRRKRMVSADSTSQSQLPFVIEKIDGKHALCGCSMVVYLDHEQYMNQSRGTR